MPEQKLTAEEAITYYFIKAWIAWDEAFDIQEWMEQGFKFNEADTNLYQAVGLAGQRWPWGYKLPRKR